MKSKGFDYLRGNRLVVRVGRRESELVQGEEASKMQLFMTDCIQKASFQKYYFGISLS
jgi:hypothetical protein